MFVKKKELLVEGRGRRRQFRVGFKVYRRRGSRKEDTETLGNKMRFCSVPLFQRDRYTDQTQVLKTQR